LKVAGQPAEDLTFHLISTHHTSSSNYNVDVNTNPRTAVKMGQNLSLVWPDTSKDVISPGNVRAEKVLGVFWLGCFWAMAMIWAMVLLVDRWRGPLGNREVRFVSVVAALVLSTAWPVVFVYLLVSP
jgi:hypothetical protein